jgi:DNA-binding beta-propeller fold protein YncE
MHHSKIKPTWVTPDPTNDYVYIAGNGSNEILKVDLNKWEIIDRIKTGKGPYNLEVSPDGKYLLASIKSEGRTGVWKLKDLSFIKNIDNSGSISHGIVISPDSKYAFTSLEGVGGDPGIVDVISLEKLEVVSSVEVGKQAGGIAFWKIEN